MGLTNMSGCIHCRDTCCSDQSSDLFHFPDVKLRQSLLLRAEMEQKGVQLDRETISCSICPDLLKDPVTIPCGHSYCMSCIKSFWDGEDQRKIYSCPQCRQAFTPRPVLVKNTMLADLVEQLKKTGLQAAPADHCYAGPEDVACDVCTGRKLKALKSCLTCSASYCKNHLQPHYDAAPLKKHKLVDPSEKLQENICSRHDEVMKMFCRTDQQSICSICSVDEHKGHDTVSAAAERTERQRELEVSRQNIQQRIQDREKDVKLLQQEVEAVNRSANKAVKNSGKIFTELISLIQKRSSDVKQQVRSQQETEVSRVKELQEKLKQEITELKRKDAELKQLSHTEDHNQFLLNYPSLSQLSAPTDSSSINIRPLRYFEDVTAAVSELRDQLQDILREKWTNISLTGTDVDFLLPEPEPKTRAGFLRYSREITLDPNTASTQLLLSDGNRKAERTSQIHPYPSHPDRFTESLQVLSRESLTGRCYWEVEWRGGDIRVAVAYKNISRDGFDCTLGLNDKSWMLVCGTDSYKFWFNHISTRVQGPVSSRVGVYLDHRAEQYTFPAEARAILVLLAVVLVGALGLLGIWVYFWNKIITVPQVEVEEGVEFVTLPNKTTVQLHEDITVEWSRCGLQLMKVHVFHNASDHPDKQDQFYCGRTNMNEKPLKTGDLSLTLRKPCYGDNGTYICTVHKDKDIQEQKVVQLRVKAVQEEVKVGEWAESVTLPFKTTAQLPADATVEWKRSDLKTMMVCVYENGQEQPDKQDEYYRGRTEMNKDPLQSKDLSVTVHNSGYSDRGTYICSACMDGVILTRKVVLYRVQVSKLLQAQREKSAEKLDYQIPANMPEDETAECSPHDLKPKMGHRYQNDQNQPIKQDEFYQPHKDEERRQTRTKTKQDQEETDDAGIVLLLAGSTDPV
ncbi:E3 ubiquitin-protein ligase TRIM47-like [Thunnus albacares]|uniref:E3 ubiquitin-protein ligase TRIM47-like n=1 Tax=Thunnus albacares TaxID=8236 RepID=UPI001CF683C5|nr:E3 ubiquitin-protein ligase TRIM47-like [Thunnus albacares]